jgi:hypothetical protein
MAQPNDQYSLRLKIQPPQPSFTTWNRDRAHLITQNTKTFPPRPFVLPHLSIEDGNPAKEIPHMTDYRVTKGEAQEDQITASIEKFTAQVPSSVYLALALGSMAASLAFQAAKKQHESLFIGQWAAPFLILGIYNKLVKIHGSDGTSGSVNI